MATMATYTSGNRCCERIASRPRVLLAPATPRATYTKRQIRVTAVSGPNGPGDKNNDKEQGLVRQLLSQAQRHANNLLHAMTPKAEGDVADVTLIVLSTGVFMWLAAEMYRLYAFSYMSYMSQQGEGYAHTHNIMHAAAHHAAAASGVFSTWSNSGF